jgi:hypothetical protein
MQRIGIFFALIVFTVMSAFASGTAEEAAELKKRIADMRAKCDRERIPVGYADEFGVYHLTPDGKAIDELETKLKKLLGGSVDPLENGRKAGWGVEPLGPVGSLEVAKSFANSPRLGGKPAFKPGLKLYG